MEKHCCTKCRLSAVQFRLDPVDSDDMNEAALPKKIIAMHAYSLLRQIGMSESRINQLLPSIELRELDRDERFGKDGLAPLTCILRGLVGTGQVSRTNGEFTLANIHSQGTWLGGEEMFNRMPTGQDYLCLAPTRLLIIPQQAALEAFEKEAEFSRYIARQQAWRQHWQAGMRHLLTSAYPAARVVFGLAMLAEALHCSYSHLAVDLPDSPLVIPVNQTLLANLCCVSRGVFSSTAQQLADAAVLQVNYASTRLLSTKVWMNLSNQYRQDKAACGRLSLEQMLFLMARRKNGPSDSSSGVPS